VLPLLWEGILNLSFPHAETFIEFMFLPKLSSSSDGMSTSVSVNWKGTGTHDLFLGVSFSLIASSIKVNKIFLPLAINEFGNFVSSLFSNTSEIDSLLCNARSGPSM
jgi:hypothetical protein